MASIEDLDRIAGLCARRMRHNLFAQLSLVSPLLLTACPSPGPDTEEEGGVTTNQSSSSTTQSQTSTTGDESTDAGTDATDATDTEDTEDTEDTDDSSGIKLDVGTKLDVPAQGECTVDWYFTESEVAELFPECSFDDIPDWVDYYEFAHVCVDKPEGYSCADICDESGWCEGMESCVWGEPFDQCGVTETDAQCCNLFAVEPLPPVGRPFLVDAELRLAEPRGSSLAALDRYAAHWYETARGEHASVAAFARFVAGLQRVGAPASLVAEALRAAADEVRHAELALEIAEDLGARTFEFGPLRVDGSVRADESLAELVEAAVVEGCVGETLAAHEAASLAACAQDPKLVAALESIAADELRHAVLAWRFVAWALERDPSLRPQVRACLARVGRGLDAPAMETKTALETDALVQGCPPASLRAHLRAQAHRSIVEPCAAALLAA